MKKLTITLLCAAWLQAQSPGVTEVTVTFSATPTFTMNAGATNFNITLTGNVTSSTFSSAAIGLVSFNICQDSSGSHTFVWPTNVTGAGTIIGQLSTCSRQTFKYDGTNALALSPLTCPLCTPGVIIPGSSSGSNTIAPAAAAGTGSTTFLAANGTTVVADTGASNNYLTAISATGAISKARPTCGNLSDSTALCTTTPGTGVATFLATPSSANLAAAITDETGTGAAVFASAPTLVNPVVGTQSAADNSTKAASTAYVDSAISTLKLQCEVVWSGSGTSFALTSGDDTVANNSCFNKTGKTWTITAVYCKSDAGSNTTTVNPTFGAAGTGTTILSGALTCGSSEAYSSTGTVSNPTMADGNGIRPAMSGTLTGTNIHMLVVYTRPF